MLINDILNCCIVVNRIKKIHNFNANKKVKPMPHTEQVELLEDLFESTESNKFQGLRYYAVSRDKVVIAIESSPEKAYYEAVSQGETTPVIICSSIKVTSPA